LPEAAPRFVWAEELPSPGATVTLAETESRYVARVCRARAGETVTLTDGRGGWAAGRVDTLEPRVVIAIERLERSDRERRAILLCGAPEGQRFDWAIEKLAELGVAVIRPVHCRRAVWTDHMVRADRWARLARSALQQSLGRFELIVEPPCALEPALDSASGAAATVMADIRGWPARDVQSPSRGDIVGLVGPADGLTEEEKKFASDRGFHPISLSENRLRTETAAVAWASWWAASALGTTSENPVGRGLDAHETQP
jgi:16S rRNA (uracil1498-N3)-methyltransferase